MNLNYVSNDVKNDSTLSGIFSISTVFELGIKWLELELEFNRKKENRWDSNPAAWALCVRVTSRPWRPQSINLIIILLHWCVLHNYEANS